MQNTTSRHLLQALLITAFLAASTGCKTTETTAGNEKKDEYVYVTVTGSNIPKRVKKSDLGTGKAGKDDQMQLADKDEAAQNTHPGVTQGN